MERKSKRQQHGTMNKAESRGIQGALMACLLITIPGFATFIPQQPARSSSIIMTTPGRANKFKMTTFQEKSLYHQIHPIKLLTDWSAGLIALYLLWQHDLVAALVVAWVPSILVSLTIVRFANLEKYKQSRFGRYIRKYMTRSMQVLRMAGYVVMAVGAWFHLACLIPLGLLFTLLGWLRGVILPGVLSLLFLIRFIR